MIFEELFRRLSPSDRVPSVSYRGYLFCSFGINEFSLFRFTGHKSDRTFIADYDFEQFDYSSSVDDFINNLHV